MKIIFLSTLLLCFFCTQATAQRKTQFGITLQSGNYLQSRQEQDIDVYQNIDYRLTPGILAGLGLYAERTLSRHAGLSSGISFFQSSITERVITTSPYLKTGLNDGVNKQSYHLLVRHLVLPVQLQLRAGVRHRMDFSIGVGPSLSMIKSDIISGYSLYENGFICGDGVGSYYQQEPDIRFQVLGTAGLHYHPDVRNAIGLECWLGPKPKEADLYLYSGYNYGYNNEPRGKNYRMRSLQVSLRHNW